MKPIRYYILVTLSLAFTKVSYGQFINLGYDRIGTANFVKAGYKVLLSDDYYKFSALTVDIGFADFDNNSFIAPSLTYNYYHMFYYVGLSATDFMGNGKQDIRIAPQIGLTCFNLVNLGYTYYIPLSDNNEIKTLLKHGLIFSVSWPLEVFKVNKLNYKFL